MAHRGFREDPGPRNSYSDSRRAPPPPPPPPPADDYGRGRDRSPGHSRDSYGSRDRDRDRYDDRGYDRDRDRGDSRRDDRDQERDRDRRGDRRDDRDGESGGKGRDRERSDTDYRGANGLRSLSGQERMDYYQQRLGGQVTAPAERGGLGYGSGAPARREDEGFNESKAIDDMKKLAQAGPTDLVQEIMRKRGAEPALGLSKRRDDARDYDPFAAAAGENLDGEPADANELAGMTAQQQQAYLQKQMEAHQDIQEQQQHASNHPLLRGDTHFSAKAQGDYVSRLTARTSNDIESLKEEMKKAVKKEDFEEAGRLKRRLETVIAEQAQQKKATADAEKAKSKKKGGFMAKQLAKINKVKKQNDQQREEEAQLEEMGGAHGDYQRFMKELEKTACHANGARGDDFFAISCNTHRII